MKGRQPTLKQLRYAVTVAANLHIGRAAAVLGIAQPPLSVQIRNLERLLGTPLFIRTSSGVSMTQAGQRFVEDAAAIIGRVDAVVEHIGRFATGSEGRLTIAYPGSALFSVVPAIIRAFRDSHPDVTLELTEAPSLRHAELLRTGLVDIGLARDPEPSKGVVNHSLVSERLLVALPSGHPLGRSAWINPGALKREPFVFFARKAHASLHDRLFGVFRDAGFEPQIVQEASDWLTATALVQAGLGITIVPESFSRIQNKSVSYRRLRSPVRTEIVACHRDEPLSPVGREFLKTSHRVGEL